MTYDPQGLALDIFKKRYALHESETWLEACDRVANHIAAAERGEDVVKYRQQYSELLKNNFFMPGGRIWYGSGRPKGQLLNCFVIPTDDSREGWGDTVRNMIVITGTGGGLGVNCSPVRPRGSTIGGSGGTATGSVSLMEIINAAGEVIKAGGGRRTALMLSLDLNHGDIVEFLDKKLDLQKLNNANVSVVFNDDPEAFFKLVKKDGDLPLTFHDRTVGKIPAREVWRKIISNALKGGEPGLLNGYHANRMSNIAYYKPLLTTNPCFAPGTLIHTKTGHYPIESLVGKTVEIWNGTAWQAVDNFRVTGENQKVLKITLQDGSSERVTPYHTVILSDGRRIKASALKAGMRLAISTAPMSHGNHAEPGAYLKGFLVADGTKMENRPLLYLYKPKYPCRGRLLESAQEMNRGPSNTNAKELGFREDGVGDKKEMMTGLALYREELFPWATVFKQEFPSEIFGWDLRSKLEFIAGAMDGDGSASDTNNGFMYQISSVYKEWLKSFQTLLKTIGVKSKLALMKSAATVDFNDGYGTYDTQDCWRLTISQAASLVLSKQVRFARLVSFSNKTIAYVVKSKFNEVVSVEKDGTEAKVYCCTVEGSHSLSLSSGNHWGQCGEIWLTEFDCCCLGALVLPRFVSNRGIDFDELKAAVTISVRFLDSVLTVNNYPLPQIAEMCSNIRRIGLGVMGLHDMLLLMGLRYNSDAGLELVHKVMGFIKNAAYEASIELAAEKGSFPKYEADKFLKSRFVKTLKPSIRSAIREKGIRNCALLTIAPTGTTSMVSAVTSGIEPMFSPAYKRRYRDGDKLKEEVVVHPLFKEFIDAGKGVKHFQGAFDIKLRDHFEMQRTCQEHLDNACSKTINLPPGTSEEELSDLYMEFFPELKGVTVYPEGSREDQPLTPMSLAEATKHTKEARVEATAKDSCKLDGNCE